MLNRSKCNAWFARQASHNAGRYACECEARAAHLIGTGDAGERMNELIRELVEALEYSPISSRERIEI